MSLLLLSATKMSDSELVQHLYDEINRQNTWYMWTVGILIGIITLIIGYFSVLQWKISDKQVKKFSDEINKAQKINKDLINSNESIIRYSLNEMANEGYLDTIVNWHRKSELYYESKNMIESYYPDNQSAIGELKHAKLAVLFAFKRKLHEIFSLETGEVYSKDPRISEMDKAFPTKEQKYPDFRVEPQDFKFDILDKVGDSLQNPKARSEWIIELYEFNKFWNEKTAD